MKDRQARESAREYFVPYILGGSAHAHAIAAQIYFRYGIVSLVCDQHPSPIGSLDPFCRYVRLSPASDSSLIAEQLLALCAQQSYTLPIIIPVSKYYEDLAEAERERLEHKFVISSKETLFSSSPLANIP